MKKYLLNEFFKFKEPFDKEYMKMLYSFLEENHPDLLKEMNKLKSSLRAKLKTESNKKSIEEFNKDHVRWFELLNQGVDYFNKHLNRNEK